MRNGQTFGEILVSQLGTPKDPVSVGSVLAGLALLLAFASYLALEYGLGQLVGRLFRRLTRRS